MLKQKLNKAIIALSFLFTAAASGGKPVSQNNFGLIITNDTTLHKPGLTLHAFDSTGLCACLPALDSSELLEVPRIQLNKHAALFVNSYLKTESYFLTKVKDKSPSYFKIIDEVFNKYNVPVELKYLAVIESKLNNKIISPVGAAGLWQFMPATARRFGLKVSSNIDERKHSYKSTVAAAKYLLYLHRIFDDWLLTIAAYNSGPGYVLSAIKKTGSRNFWVIQNALPRETRKHVNKFVAMHYYFEGHGSLATLTKSETKAHIDAVATFVEKQNENKPDSLSVEIVKWD